MIPNRIIVIGGSTVYGQGDSEGGGFVSYLRAWHETESPEDHRVFNLGIGGDSVSDMLKRAEPECKARRPDLVILYPGLNDIRRTGHSDAPTQTNMTDFSSNLEKLIGDIKSIAPLIIMSSVTPDESRTSPFRGKWFFSLAAAQECTEKVSQVAVKMQIPYLPIFEEFKSLPNHNDLLFDGLHCNTTGHRILFEKLKLFLENMYLNGIAT